MYPLRVYLCIHTGQNNHYISTSVTGTTPVLFNPHFNTLITWHPHEVCKCFYFHRHTKVIKLILCKLSKTRLWGKSTIHLPRMELRIFDTHFKLKRWFHSLYRVLYIWFIGNTIMRHNLTIKSSTKFLQRSQFSSINILKG